MLIVDKALEARAAEGKPVRFAMVGCGFMGRGVVNQVVNSTPGMDIVAIATRRPETARAAFAEAGITDVVEADTPAAVDAAVAAGKHVVTADPTAVCRAETVEAMVEVTGAVEYGAHATLDAIEHGKKVSLSYPVINTNRDIGTRLSGALAVKYNGNHGLEDGTTTGPLIDGKAVAKVQEHIADALAKGATLLAGGKVMEGNFFEPTILVDVDHTMRCMREETFGPTLAIMKVSDEDEAIALANDSEYGLSSSIWTSDRARGERLARCIEAGSVSINNALVATFQLPVPMGGWKNSGLGTRFGGAQGVLKYCRQQAVVEEKFTLKSEPLWYPVVPTKARLIAAAARFLGAHDWRRRLGRPGR